MKGDKSTVTHGVGGDGLQPIVVEVEKNHLWFGRFQDQISKLLNFEASLEGKLQFGAFDDDVGEVEQVNLTISRCLKHCKCLTRMSR